MASNSRHVKDAFAVFPTGNLVICFHEDPTAAPNSETGSKICPLGWVTPITISCRLVKGLPPRQHKTTVKFLEKVTFFLNPLTFIHHSSLTSGIHFLSSLSQSIRSSNMKGIFSRKEFAKWKNKSFASLTNYAISRCIL